MKSDCEVRRLYNKNLKTTEGKMSVTATFVPVINLFWLDTQTSGGSKISQTGAGEGATEHFVEPFENISLTGHGQLTMTVPFKNFPNLFQQHKVR